MQRPIALSMVLHSKGRALAVVSGVGFSILLMFLQLGFYDSCRRSATLLYDLFAFDAVIVSPVYNYVVDAGTVPESRLGQLRSVPGVARILPFYTGTAQWRNPSTQRWWEMSVLGVRPADRPFARADVNGMLPLVSGLDTVLIDEKTRASYGPRMPGIVTEVNGRRVRLVGSYRHGVGFLGGAVLVSDATFAGIFRDRSVEHPSFGLVQFAPGANAGEVMAELKARLPADATAWTREELEETERHFWLHVKPMGLMFTSGVVVAFLVGAVILYQVLLSEVANHVRELATLSALGYTPSRLRGIVLGEGLVFALLGFVPAALLASFLYGGLARKQSLPLFMTGTRLSGVFLLSVVMCVSAGFLATRRVSKADPAELF